MSTLYNLEPQPTGSVVLHTTRGEIAVELFAKQTPLTCRNFLQHCLDGYYDNTIFHRLVPGFVVQGGDPTGTGSGGESIYDGGALAGELDAWPMEMRTGRNAGEMGVGFKDEVHSRLKFNRRGLLGMANEGASNTNGSQFFFTLAKADELTGKNTVFGRIAGDTIYNLAKIGEEEVQEGTDRPTYPVRVTKTEILVNPFPDMQRRVRVAAAAAAPARQHHGALAERRKKRKGGRQLLSFGDDEEGDEGDAADFPVLKKAKFDTRIVADAGEEEPVTVGTKARGHKKTAARTTAAAAATHPSKREGRAPEEEEPARRAGPGRQELETHKGGGDNEEHRDNKERNKDSKERNQRQPPPPRDDEPPPPEPAPRPKKTALERTNEEIAAVKAAMRRTIHTATEPAAPVEAEKTALQQMIPENSTRGRRRGAGGKMNVSDAEDQRMMSMLLGFQARLKQAPALVTTKPDPARPGGFPGDGAEGSNTTAAGEQDRASPTAAPEDSDAQLCDLHFIPNCQSCRSWDAQDEDHDNTHNNNEGWMSHMLSFQADRLGKDLRMRRKAEEELVVIDPRERERTFKEEKRAEREARMGGGKGGREWDQARDRARNAQMTRMASLAGRGAK